MPSISEDIRIVLLALVIAIVATPVFLWVLQVVIRVSMNAVFTAFFEVKKEFEKKEKELKKKEDSE